MWSSSQAVLQLNLVDPVKIFTSADPEFSSVIDSLVI